MSAIPPREAIFARLEALPPLDIEPVETIGTGMFTRLAKPIPDQNQEIETAAVRADYVRALARLNEAVAQMKVHFTYHCVEALCLANLNPNKAKYYVADLANAAHAIEQIISPDSSAVDRHSSRIWG